MTVSLYKLSIVGAVSLLLVGCSYTGRLPFVGQWASPQTEKQQGLEKTSAPDVCLPEAGSPFHFRKGILIAGTIGVPGLARDLPGLPNLTSWRLQTHLDALDRFNVLANHDTSFESRAMGTAAHVRQLGQEYASQFVVKIELEDLTIHSKGNWLTRLMGGSAKRNVMIKLYVYDTEYGALFHSKRYQRTVSGDVIGFPGESMSVTTPWFNTDLGKQIDDILKDMSMQINKKLACIPFSTEVTAIKGNDVYIKAGYLHGIRPGETLRVYRRSDILEPEGSQKQGKNDGWIRVYAVFPNHSVAVANQDVVTGYRLDAGDIVRAW